MPDSLKSLMQGLLTFSVGATKIWPYIGKPYPNRAPQLG